MNRASKTVQLELVMFGNPIKQRVSRIETLAHAAKRAAHQTRHESYFAPDLHREYRADQGGLLLDENRPVGELGLKTNDRVFVNLAAGFNG